MTKRNVEDRLRVNLAPDVHSSAAMRELVAIGLVLALSGCGGAVESSAPSDGRDDAFFAGGKGDGGLSAAEVAAVLTLANTADFEELDDGVPLDRRAAEGIWAHRVGPDGVPGSADDDPFDTLAELDAVPWVGPAALQAMLAYADVETEGATCLIISEYVESTTAYNKAIELFNCGDTALPLDEYALCLVRNDDTDCTLTTTLPAVELEPGEVFVGCRSTRDHTIDPFPQLVARCDEELGSVMINSGDDRMVVLHAPNGEDSVGDATVMDVLGRIDFRPWWNPWADVDLRRCVAEPNSGTVFYDTSEWFETHHHFDFSHLGVEPSFDCG